MLPIIIVLISLLLDGFLTNILPYTVENLSLLTPSLTLISLLLIYPFYRKKEMKYTILILITGVIYDLLYTNLLFFNAILFYIDIRIMQYIYKNYEINYFTIIINTIIAITTYEVLQVIIISIYNLYPITLYSLVYKIKSSLLLNIIYAELIYFIISIIPRKYRKININ